MCTAPHGSIPRHACHSPFSLAEIRDLENSWPLYMRTHLYLLKLGETVPTDICVPPCSMVLGAEYNDPATNHGPKSPNPSADIPRRPEQPRRPAEEPSKPLEMPRNPARGAGARVSALRAVGYLNENTELVQPQNYALACVSTYDSVESIAATHSPCVMGGAVAGKRFLSRLR